jgi:hypothetical protein
MAVSKAQEKALLREHYLNKFIEFSKAEGEDARQIASNQFCFPVVGCNGSEEWIQITVAVPLGSNKGKEPFDGYAAEDNYKFKLQEDAKKAKKKEEERQKKMERDAEYRRKKAEQKRNAE